jgi:hypothetical protein
MIRRLALGLLVSLLAATAASADLAPWTAHSAMKVRPTDPPAGLGAPRLYAARGEWEATQVIVTDAAGGALSACDVTVTPLAGPGADLTAIDLYREVYLWIEHPSRKPGSPETKGWWPDPLVPFADPYFGEDRDGSPFDVPAGENVPIWIEVKVPVDQTPGEYAGEIEVACAEGSPVLIPLTLTVWDITLPEKISLPSSYGYSCGGAYEMHQAMGGTVEKNALTQLYYREALRHRLMFNSGHCVGPEWHWDEGTQEGSFDMTAFDAEVGPVFNGTLEGGASFDTYRMPYPPGGASRDEQVAFWRTLAQAFRDRGWLDKMYLYLPDEPRPEEYPRLVDLAATLHEADPELRTLATEQIAPGLVGSVDIWCPDEPLFSDWMPSPPFPEDYAERRAQGEETWWYNCMSAQFGLDFSNHFVDEQGTYLRIWPWLTRRYGFTGILFWHTLYVYRIADDPWVDQYSPEFFVNGDGTLFYPGVPAKIGGTHDIPIASLRLKMLREGIEDYEYFTILDGMDLADFVQAEVEARASRTYQWDHDPLALENSRQRLAARILGTLDTEAPDAPTGLATAVGVTSVTLTWDGALASDVAGYEVSLARYPGERVLVLSTDAATRSAEFTGLEEWKPVTLTVRAFDLAGNRGPWADEVTATPRAPEADDDSGDDDTGDDTSSDDDDNDDDGCGC